mgnify:FL=1
MTMDLVPWEARAFAGSLFVYHVSEYAIARAYNRATLSRSSFLFSTPYCVAMSLAVLEYALELVLAPELKRASATRGIKIAGLACATLGDGLRKAAQVTAGASFTHLIQTKRRREHQLITHGVYRHIRHPGYLGWLVWCVGTQILLCNPIGAVGFAVAAWRFFKARVPFEEARLRAMFPGEYAAYAARTRTWIPGIP